MNQREVALKNKILEFRIGSFLYGTNTPTSDEDYSGVFMPDENMVFGFDRTEQVDLSLVSKSENGKNTADAIDKVLYEFRKFVKLSLENNPNILEMLFVNSSNLLFADEYGKELLSNAHLFPHKKLKERFRKYAGSQKHKMIIRTDSFHALSNAQEFLNDFIKTEYDRKMLLAELLPKRLPFFTEKGNHIQLGDLNLQKSFQLRKVKKIVDARLEKATNRAGLMTKYGYDTKFGSHLVRLMLEGVELLKTGRITFPLKDRELLVDIKTGKYKIFEVLRISEELEKEIESLAENSSLPSKPRYHEVQELTKGMLKKFLLEYKND